MIISDLYQTNITCSNYNATIDSGDGSTTITVTVKLEDFNKNAVSGKSVTLTVDKGYFKSVTGTSTTNYSNTTTKSVSATTKSDGTITAVYVPSEWGLATFSANTTKIQIEISGWKRLYANPGGTITIYRNKDLFRLHGTDHSISLTNTKSWQDRMSFADYVLPDSHYHCLSSAPDSIFCRILSNGQFQMKNVSGTAVNNTKISFTILGKLDES